MPERQQDSCPEHHPHQCAPIHSGHPASSHEALSKPSASDEFLAKLAELGVLGVARPNEDPFKYAAKLAAREAKAGACRGSPAPGHAVCTTCTPAPLRSPLLPIANSGLPTPSFIFAATAASNIDVVPHSPAHLAPPSPPSSPIQPRLNEQAETERTARETIARWLKDHLEAHPEPIIGSIDNPFPFADKYGIRGISILSVFFDHLDMDTFPCHFCSDQHDSVDDALEHQRTARHYS